MKSPAGVSIVKDLPPSLTSYLPPLIPLHLKKMFVFSFFLQYSFHFTLDEIQIQILDILDVE